MGKLKSKTKKGQHQTKDTKQKKVVPGIQLPTPKELNQMVKMTNFINEDTTETNPTSNTKPNQSMIPLKKRKLTKPNQNMSSDDDDDLSESKKIG